MTEPGCNVMSQKQYLQKYLSKTKKKKKKDKISSSTLLKRSQIIDDDDDLVVNGGIDDEEYNFDYLGDEAPQIAGIVDERPLEVRCLDHYDDKNWKSVGKPDVQKYLSKISTEFDSNLESGVLKENFKIDQKKTGRETKILLQSKNDDSNNSPPLAYSSDKYKRKNAGSDSDLSPPRVQNSNKHNPDQSVKGAGIDKSRRKSRHDYDESPPRVHNKSERKRKHDSDRYRRPNTEKTRKKSESDSDISSPREPYPKLMNKYQTPEKSRNSDSDLSPPRSSKQDKHKDKKESRSRGYLEKKSYSKNYSKDQNYSRKRNSLKDGNERDSDSNEFPSRKKDKNDIRRSESDRMKKERKSGRESESDSDLSLDRYSKQEKPKRHESKGYVKYSSESKSSNRMKEDRVSSRDRDRKYKNSDSFRPDHRKAKRSHSRDSTTSRNRSDPVEIKKTKLPSKNSDREEKDTFNGKSSDSHRKDTDHDQKSEKMKKTLDGKRAGLQNAGNLKEELNVLKQKEDQMFKEMATNMSGEGAAPVMRDRKTGKKRDLEREKEESAIDAAKQAERKEKYYKWGKGLKQVEANEKRISDVLHEMSKPLARYATDDDLENYLKAQEREGDPMLDYIRQKQSESVNVNEPSKPKYKGSFMPNRFGIAPGYRWDGVDRSNGYEKSWFEHRNAKKAVEEEAYKWSTSDM